MNEKITKQDALIHATNALACALKHRDSYTLMHSERVVSLAADLGKSIGLSKKEIESLKISAQLHDIGKIGIDDKVLLKKTKFEPYEWDFMKTHSVIGSKIVNCLELENSDLISESILHHHENFDGTGYPDGLAGEAIPILSRIITLADCYDAMTESRPYHSAKQKIEALHILEQEQHKFDPYLYSRFLKLLS